MKQNINGKIYDTDTALFISDTLFRDPAPVGWGPNILVYRTTDGEYFLHYLRHSHTKKECIVLISEDEIKGRIAHIENYTYTCDLCGAQMINSPIHIFPSSLFSLAVNSGLNPLTFSSSETSVLDKLLMEEGKDNLFLKNWKDFALKDKSKWGLCSRCNDAIMKYI